MILGISLFDKIGNFFNSIKDTITDITAFLTNFVNMLNEFVDFFPPQIKAMFLSIILLFTAIIIYKIVKG